jgi:gas vesicle protein
MAEFLHGFTQADFSVLKDITSPLKSIIDTLISGGAMAKVAGKELFYNLSKGLISGLSSGNMEGIFSQITQAAGTYGVELVKLTKLSIQYAMAQKNAAAAEKALNDAKAKEQKLDTKLQLQLLEYNDLARAGASPEVLAAKLAGINATEDQLIASQSETKAAEEQKQAADDQMKTMKEQVDLQKALVDTLIDLAKAEDDVRQAQIDAAKAGAGGKGAGAGAGAGMPAMEWTGLGDTLQSKISDAIDNAKGLLMMKLNLLWAGIKQSINDNIIPAISNFLWAWRDLVSLISPYWEGLKTGWDATLKWIEDQTYYFTATMENWWYEHGGNVKLITDDMWAGIKLAYETGKAAIDGILGVFFLIEGQTWGAAWEFIKLLASQAWEFLKTSFDNGLNFLGALVDAFAALLRGDWDTMWSELKFAAEIWWESIKNAVKTGLENIRALIDLAKEIGGDLIMGIAKGIAENAYEVIKAISTAVKNAIQAAKDAAKGHSPSLVFAAIGKDFMLGMAQGIDSMAKLPALQVAKATSAAMVPAMAAQSIATNNYRTANINMGGVNINGNMGAAEFEAAIRRVLRSEFAT